MRALAVIAMLILPGLASAQTPTPHTAAPQRRPEPASGASPAAAPNRATPPTPPAAARPEATHPQTPSRAAPTVRAKPGPNAQRPPTAHAPPPPPPAPPAQPEKPAEPQKGSSTGMPLPRYAALRSDEVNFRSGPGVRYPIEWVYRRRDLPVLIQREFEVWRLVEDQEGVKGWVHQATLVARRTAVVTGAERILRQSAEDAATAVAKLKPGVTLRLRSCEAGSPWCQAQVGDYRGWIKRSEFWGTFPGEAIP